MYKIRLPHFYLPSVFLGYLCPQPHQVPGAVDVVSAVVLHGEELSGGDEGALAWQEQAARAGKVHGQAGEEGRRRALFSMTNEIWVSVAPIFF